MSGSNGTPGFMEAHNSERTRDTQPKLHQNLGLNQNHRQNTIMGQNRNEVNDESSGRTSHAFVLWNFFLNRKPKLLK